MIQTLLNLFKPSYERGFYLLPTDERKWKRVIELNYEMPGNILVVTTFDGNIRQFYHALNDAPTAFDNTNLYEWKRHPSRTIIKDNELIESLDKCYRLVLSGTHRKGQGWVRCLNA